MRTAWGVVVAGFIALGPVACSQPMGSNEPPDLVDGLAVSDAVVEGEVVRLIPGKRSHPDRLVLSDLRMLWDGQYTVDGDGNKVELPDLPDQLRTVQNVQDVPDSAVGRRIVAAVAYAGEEESDRWRTWQIEYSLDSETMKPHGGVPRTERQLRRVFMEGEDTADEKRAAFVELTVEAAADLHAKNLGEPKPTAQPRLTRIYGGR